MEAAPAVASNESLRYIRTLADRATATAAAVPSGPVHVNFPISDPLTPMPGPLMPAPQREADAWIGRPTGKAYTVVNDAEPALPSPEKLSELVTLLRTARRGLIIAGPQPDPSLAEPLTQLAASLGYPLLADPLSQLRVPPAEDASSSHQAVLVATYDAFLKSESEHTQSRGDGDRGASDDEAEYAPDVILRFGAMPTSKALLLYLQRHSRRCPLIVITRTDRWDEPTQLASEMIHADPAAFCAGIMSLLTVRPHARATSRSLSAWEHRWQATEVLTRRTLGDAVVDLPELFEGRVFTELARLLPAGSTLFGGNSMPVRDMDTFFWGNKARIQIFGNRGANGIDGVISSALGMSAAHSQISAPSSGRISGRTVLVIGDLSFYHDSNGLLAALLHRLDLTIVLVNNDGGGIFSFLPQSAFPEHFEQLFGTPTGLDFQPLVQMYGGHFERIHDWSDFEQALQSSWQTGGLWVIEVATNRSTNVLMHRQLRQQVRQALDKSRIASAAPLPAEKP
jgi:2-succinyl-5-enolpyruvyl-6-hydroxy-3-cyclohexene-1-carboxylate synthase